MRRPIEPRARVHKAARHVAAAAGGVDGRLEVAKRALADDRFEQPDEAEADAEVEGVGAEGVADGHVGVAVAGGDHGGDEVGEGRADGGDGEAHDGGRDVRGWMRPTCEHVLQQAQALLRHNPIVQHGTRGDHCSKSCGMHHAARWQDLARSKKDNGYAIADEGGSRAGES